MNKKLLITLSGLLILSGVVLLIMKNIPSFYNEEMKLSVLLNDVKSLKVNDGIMIVRKDGIWCSRDDDYYPVNNQMVDELVARLQNAALHTEKNNANVEGKDKIVLSAGDGEKISLFFDEEGHTGQGECGEHRRDQGSGKGLRTSGQCHAASFRGEYVKSSHGLRLLLSGSGSLRGSAGMQGCGSIRSLDRRDPLHVRYLWRGL